MNQEQKRLQWEQIKSTDLKLADWLSTINRTFGKPAALSVVLIGTGEIIETGAFDAPKTFYDGKVRTRKHER